MNYNKFKKSSGRDSRLCVCGWGLVFHLALGSTLRNCVRLNCDNKITENFSSVVPVIEHGLVGGAESSSSNQNSNQIDHNFVNNNTDNTNLIFIFLFFFV